MIFETVAQLKLATLTAGQLVSTKGYYASGDGGAADYIVAATQAVDGYGDHSLANSTVALLQGSSVKSLGVSNSLAGTTLGTVTGKVEIFDAAGVSLGFLPLYDAIT